MTSILTTDPTRIATGQGLWLRPATASDNDALIELAAACTMQGDIALRIDRSPDFFALNRLEGDRSRIGIVSDEQGRVLGCVAVAARRAYVNGVPSRMAYASDLKVHPVARRSGAADLLTEFVRDAATEMCGADAPVMCTILAGNTAMENRARGPRGMPVLSPFATLSVLAIPLLWERGERMSGIRVREAREDDLDAMALVWRHYARSRQFADDRNANDLDAWIRRAPGLSIGNYLLATDVSGHLRGFLAVWDQRDFKQMRVVSYSRRLAVARHAINFVAPLSGSAKLPTPGGVLPALATVHVCAQDPLVLRSLLLEAYRQYRGAYYSFLAIGLDNRDPLRAALTGLLAQPTNVNAYVTTSTGSADPRRFTDMLLHHETALV